MHFKCDTRGKDGSHFLRIFSDDELTGHKIEAAVLNMRTPEARLLWTMVVQNVIDNFHTISINDIPVGHNVDDDGKLFEAFKPSNAAF